MFSHSIGRQSCYLTETLLFLGASSTSYENACKILSHFTKSPISGKTIENKCNKIGKQLESVAQDTPILSKQNSLTYMMMDGSMLSTKKHGWKEVKLCRIFQDDPRQSIYIGYINHMRQFLDQVDKTLLSYKNTLVVVGDGAPWIWHFVNEKHPDAIQILDYPHAVEYLSKLKHNELISEALMIQYKQQLIDNQNAIQDIIDDLLRLKPEHIAKQKILKTVIGYFSNNRQRMQYKTFKALGYHIGSGAIESANKKLIQERMKNAGQHWTLDGAQAMINLRVLLMENRWTIVNEHIKHAS